jgi:hypothetical protein
MVPHSISAVATLSHSTSDLVGREPEGCPAGAGGHASAAMTLDADLFDTDMSAVADSVGKMWDREAKCE